MTRPLDPALTDLRTELERAGLVVVPHGDHICVRLPLLASVRARIDEGRLRLDPQLGPLRRTSALMITLIGATAAGVGGFLTLGPSPEAFAIGFAGLGAMVTDVARLVMTENCMTRLQLVFSLTNRLRHDAGAAIAPGASTVPRVGPPPLEEVRREPARVDRA